jgi:hypothetical protein
MEIFLTTNNRGHGVRAARAVRRGEFVVEYAGEVIDVDEVQRRMDAQREKVGGRLVTLSGGRLVILAGAVGGGPGGSRPCCVASWVLGDSHPVTQTRTNMHQHAPTPTPTHAAHPHT